MVQVGVADVAEGFQAPHVVAVVEGVPHEAFGNRLRKGRAGRYGVVLPRTAAARGALPLFFLYGDGLTFPAVAG